MNLLQCIQVFDPILRGNTERKKTLTGS